MQKSDEEKQADEGLLQEQNEQEPQADLAQENTGEQESINEQGNADEQQISNEQINVDEQQELKKVKIKKIIGHEVRTNRYGYLFVAPFVVVFCIFNLWPTIYTFMLGFTNLRGLRSEYDFVGIENYARLITDVNFWGALGNTFIIWGFNFAPQLGVALILAIWLSDTRLNLAGKGAFRAIIYMPNLLTAASVALLFRSLFGFGSHVQAPANQFLRALGVEANVMLNGEMVREAFNFFRSVPFARGLTAFIQWWMWYGHTLIMLMAGITSIPISLYESAVVDGANSRQTAWHITLPLLRPMMLYILVTSMIGGMQMFDIPFLLTDMRGGPDYKIRTTVVYQYNMAFQGRNDYAYGAAISMGIFIVTILLALLIFFFLQDRSELKKKKLAKGGVV
jgi:multiple sugar transport system permease protein